MTGGTTRRVRVLIVADETKQMDALKEVLLQKAPYRFETVGQPDLPQELAPYESVIMYVHKPLLARTEEQLIDYTTTGGRLVVLHHGIASAKLANPRWLDFVGIHIEPKDAPDDPWRVVSDVTHTVVNLRPGHFITTNGVEYEHSVEYRSSDRPSVSREYPAIDLLDTEVFLNQHFSDGRSKTVLLGFRCEDPVTGTTICQDRCGWVKTVGRGILVYLQGGHRPEDFQNRAYSQIIYNSLMWSGVEERLPPVQPSVGGRREFWKQDPYGWKEIVFDAAKTGWREYAWPPGSGEITATVPSAWQVDTERRLLCTNGQPHTHLMSEKLYEDFILHTEWRYLPGVGTLNSGLFVRMIPDRQVMHQIETLMDRAGIIMGGSVQDGVLTPICAVVPDGSGGWVEVENHTSNKWLTDIKRTNAVQKPIVPREYGPSEDKQVNAPGQWNTYEILCIDTRIVVWLNRRIASYTDKCTIRAGAIGFEAEGHPIEFRNIRVKEIRA